MPLPALNRLFADVPWCVVDLETDGPDPAVALPCEVAVARFERGELVGSWSTFLNPGREMSAEVIGVHGVTNEMVAEAPPAAKAIWLLLETGLLDGAYPVGYNGQDYDRAILRRIADPERQLTDGALVPWLGCTWIDPLVMVRDIDRFVPGSGRHRLSVACARHGIEHVDAHRAFGDCNATGKLLWSLRERIGDMTLEQLLSKQIKRAQVQEAEFQKWLSRQPKRDEPKRAPGPVVGDLADEVFEHERQETEADATREGGHEA
jgi:DNA polymerase III epsilon subunit-like protein